MADSNKGRNNAHILLDNFLERATEIYKEREDKKAEVKDLSSQLKEELAEMKAQGFDVKLLNRLLAISLETAEQRELRLEEEAVLATYKQAVGLDDA